MSLTQKEIKDVNIKKTNSYWYYQTGETSPKNQVIEPKTASI